MSRATDSVCFSRSTTTQRTQPVAPLPNFRYYLALELLRFMGCRRLQSFFNHCIFVFCHLKNRSISFAGIPIFTDRKGSKIAKICRHLKWMVPELYRLVLEAIGRRGRRGKYCFQAKLSWKQTRKIFRYSFSYF